MVHNEGTSLYSPIRSIANHYSAVTDASGYVLLGKFDTDSTPSTAANRFQKGCQMVKTDAADTVKAIYENVGTLAAPSWNLLGDISSADIANGAVTLAKLATAVAPSHVIKFGGQLTTVGGSATEAFTVTGAAATDRAFCQMVDNGTGNVTILQAVVTTNTLTITFSGNPGNDTIFNYQIIRATS